MVDLARMRTGGRDACQVMVGGSYRDERSGNTLFGGELADRFDMSRLRKAVAALRARTRGLPPAEEGQSRFEKRLGRSFFVLCFCERPGAMRPRRGIVAGEVMA